MFSTTKKIYGRLRMAVLISFALATPIASAAPLQNKVTSSGNADSKSQRSVEVTATVTGIQSADIYAKIGGFMERIDVDLGDKFSKGDVLAVLDVPEMETDVLQKAAMVKQAEAEAKQATAAIAEAEARRKGFEAAIEEAKSTRAAKQAQFDFETKNYNRLSQMAHVSSIRRELVDEAQLKVQAAQADIQSMVARVATADANLIGADAAIEKAKADAIASDSRIAVAQAFLKHAEQLLGYATIKAPWDGVVLERLVDAGAFIQSAAGNSAAQPLLRIARVDKVRVTFAISNADTTGLKIGNRAVLSRVAGLPDETFTGKVSRFSGGLDERTRMLKVEVELENSDGKLKPGAFGYITVDLN